MKYYIISGNKWIQSKFDPQKRLINLYDDNLNFFGIGMY